MVNLNSISWSAVKSCLARESFLDFVTYTKRDYKVKWFHKLICEKLDDFAEGKIKRLMIFMPSQCGKSELTSRRLAAYLFGKNPNVRIAGLSYNHTFAASFNRDIQRIMDSEKYAKVFPEVKLFGKNVRTSGTWLRNSDEFEIVGHTGSYISVGVGGGISGKKVDIAIMDDVIKDMAEAYSITYRNKLWTWYWGELNARLYNHSQIIFTITRRHEDDLAGRLLQAFDDWEVITLPAIKEEHNNDYDIREIGEALWPEQHSKEYYLKIKEQSLSIFTSMCQQRPAPLEGGMIKRDWLQFFDELPDAVWNFAIDSAYTTKEQNDPSVILCYAYHENNLYIRNVSVVRLEMPELLKHIQTFAHSNGYTNQSMIYVEPKASGKSIVQVLRKGTGLNVTESKNPTTDKVARLASVSTIFESKRVHLLNHSSWIASYVDELCIFPNVTHDDQVDATVIAIQQSQSLGTGWANKYKHGNNRNKRQDVGFTEQIS